MIDKSIWTDAGFNRKFMAADEKHRTAPHTLTDDDIWALDAYHGNGDQMRRARETALATVRAKAAPHGDNRIRKDETFDQWVKRCPKAPVTVNMIASLIHNIGELAGQLRQRDAALEARVSALDGTPVAPAAPAPKPKVRLRGPWSPSAEYAHDDGVVRHGMLWRCSAGPTNEPPRTGAVCWQLVNEVVAGDVQP